MKETMIQKIRAAILYTVGILALFVIAADETPDQPPMSDALFLISKAAAGIVVYGCYRLGKRWERMGLIVESKKEKELKKW